MVTKAKATRDIALQRRRLYGELTIQEAATELGRSYGWVYEKVVEKGVVPYRRDGGIIFLDRHNLPTLAAYQGKPGRPRVWQRIDGRED